MAIELNQTYHHQHNPAFTCVPVEHTNKGAKVLQTQTFPDRPRKKPKTVTAFYDSQDFGTGGLWERT
jgi:hypothetical protein